jgi:hypothetical protein
MPPKRKTNQIVMQEALRKHGAETRVIQTQSNPIINQDEPNTSQRLSTQHMETKTTLSDKLYEGARPKKIMKPVHENNDDSEDETDSQTEDDRSFEETTETEASTDDDIAVADPRNKQPRGDSNVWPMTIAFSGMPMLEYIRLRMILNITLKT